VLSVVRECKMHNMASKIFKPHISYVSLRNKFSQMPWTTALNTASIMSSRPVFKPSKIQYSGIAERPRLLLHAEVFNEYDLLLSSVYSIMYQLCQLPVALEVPSADGIKPRFGEKTPDCLHSLSVVNMPRVISGGPIVCLFIILSLSLIAYLCYILSLLVVIYL